MKLNLASLTAGALLVATARGDATGRCDDGWELFTGLTTWYPLDVCIGFYAGPVSWDTALANCPGHFTGATLASVHTSAMGDDLYDLCVGRQCSIGYTDDVTEGTFYWLDGTADDYAPWNDGTGFAEPDGSGDCTVLYKKGGVHYFNDVDCFSEGSPYFCAYEAGCSEGYYKDSGACIECPAGTYRDEAAGDLLASCFDCSAGRYGTATAETDPDCTGDCSAGYYCPEGSATATSVACPAGTFGAVDGLDSSACSGLCTAGYYCGLGETTASPSGQLCAAGRFGTEGQTDSDCSGPCSAGYYCPEGSSAATANECGSVDKYCPSSSSSPSDVTTGYYTTPADDPVATRTGQALCEAGYYCTGGERFECPAGRYGSSTGDTSSTCTGECAAGYYCPAGSKSSTQQPCGFDETNPENWYCPAGTSAKIEVDPDYYSTPVTNAADTRSGQAACPETSTCNDGVAEPRLEWTTCDSAANVAENDASSDVTTVTAQSNLVSNPTPVYSLAPTLDFRVTTVLLLDGEDNTVDSSGVGQSVTASSVSYSTTHTMGNKAFSLAGSSGSNIQSSSCTDFSLLEGSFTAWVRPTDDDWSTYGDLFYYTADSTHRVKFYKSADETLNLVHNTGNGNQGFSIDDSAYNLFEVGVWTHIAITWSQSGEFIRLYSDGVLLVEQLVAAANWGSDPAGDFKLSGGNGGYWKGYVDDVGFFSEALEDSEVFSVYTYGLSVPLTTCPSDPFAIDAATGVISIDGSAFDYEECTDVAITTYATTDDGSEIDVVACTTLLSIDDQNDAPTVSDASGDIDERSDINTNVGLPMDASDPDFGQEATFSIDNSGDGALGEFGIGSCSGQVFTTQDGTLDAEAKDTYSLPITVSDGGSPELSDTAVFTVTVLNVNDAPVIDLSSVSSFNVDENAEGATLSPGAAEATDLDTGDTLTWSITRNDDDKFEVSSAGLVSIVSGVSLDYETKAAYSIELEVSDGDLDDRADYVIAVNDMNDPPFLADYSLEIDENSATSTAVGTVLDASDDDGDDVTFSITGGNTGSVFSVTTTDAANGYGQIEVAGAIDYETLDTYTLTVTVSDGTDTYDATVTVDVLNVNENPAIDTAQVFSVSELATTGTSVGTVTGDDVDGNSVFYSITAGAEGDFSMDTSGELFTAGALDYDAGTQTYTISVRAEDNGSPSLSDSADITVNVNNENEAPVVDAQAFSVDENSADATVVDSVVASDPESDSLTYSLEASSQFDMSGADVVVATGATIDFETTPTVALTVTVSDGSLSTDALITINLNDVNEAPVLDATYSLSAVQDDDEGTLVGSAIVGTDEDGDSLTYSIVTPDPSNDDLELSSDGQFSVATGATLDDSLITYTYVIKANDGALDSNDATVTVSVTDVNHTPELTIPTGNTVAEDATVGTQICQVSATDSDGDTLEFSFAASSSIFEIDGSTGAISLLSSNLDFETESSYSLTVIVTDDGEGTLSASGSITIAVGDVNESPSILNPNEARSIAENSPLGTTVSPVVDGYDPDAADAGNLVFSVTSAPSVFPFDLDASTGEFTVNADDALDYETTTSYTVTARVTDVAGLYVEASITISVTNVNEPPSIGTTAFSVTENAGVGTALGSLSVADPDTTTLYTWIVGGDLSGAFKLQAHSLLVENAVVDFEEYSSYSLEVVVSDLEFNVTEIVTVTVVNENDVTITDIAYTPTIGTAGGDDVVLTGTNFGPTAGGGTATATYGPATGLEYTAFGCVVSAANTEVTCQTVAGLGADHFWVLTVDGDDFSTESTALTTSYPAPNVTDATAAALGTDGGDTITLSGLAAGMVPAGTAVGVTYGPVTGLEYTATGCVGSVAYSAVECTSVVGAGADMTFYLTVEGQTSAAFTPSPTAISYAVPSIDSVVTSNGALLDTAGGESVIITGNDFGPLATVVSASYGDGAEDSYDATCAVTTAHTVITCSSASGVGLAHAWTVTVAGQESAASADTTAYQVPILLSLSGTGTVDAQTQGGQLVTLTGEQFGPEGETPSAWYGVTASEFTAAGCFVATANTIIVCETAAGTGTGHSWQMSVGSQDSNVLAAGTGYAPPTILEYTGEGESDATTTGGEVVTISGTNFGSIAADAVDSVTYGATGVEFTAVDCNITVNHEQIQCFTGEGAGEELSWVVTVDGQESRSPTTSYAVPAITAITGAGSTDASTNGGEVVTLTGTDFYTSSPDGQVTYGKIGTEYTAANCVLTVDHFEIECETVRGVGANLQWYVTVAGQVSVDSGLTTNYAAPAIDSIGPSSGPTAGGTTVYVTGTNFGGYEEDPVLYFGGTATAASRVQLNETTHLFVFKTSPNDYAGNPYQVWIKAGSQTSGTVDFNYANNVPVILDAARSVDENSADGTTVGAVVTGTDEDSEQTLAYSIEGGNTNSAFAIDGSSGQITVATSSELDFEVTASYDLVVRASDGIDYAECTVTVSIGDVNEAPVIDATFSFTVDENSAYRTTVGGLVTAVDEDAGTSLRYSITSDDYDNFEIADSFTAQISVQSGATLDFEAVPQYTLTVKVTDGTNDAFSTVTVDVNDVNETPFFYTGSGNDPFAYAAASSYACQTDEVTLESSGASTGDAISVCDVQVPTAYDWELDTLSYTLTDASGLFALSSAASPTIVIAGNASQADYETVPGQSVTVTLDVSDGSLDSSVEVTIAFENVNERPVVEDAFFFVSEETANGTAIGAIDAYDPDVLDTEESLTFTLEDAFTFDQFAVDATTGVVSIVDRSGFERNQVYLVGVVVTDEYGSSAVAVANITIIDFNFTPTLAEILDLTVAENSAVPTVVGTVTGSDEDGDDLFYSVRDGTATSTKFEVTTLNNVGTLQTRQELDFEAKEVYDLTCVVTDAPGVSAEALCRVTVLDVNETPVMADQACSEPENEGAVEVCAVMDAQDPDAGTTLVYSMVSGADGDGMFTIDSSTGQLSTTGNLNYEDTSSYTLTVSVSDQSAEFDDVRATVTVTVEDLNEYPELVADSWDINEDEAITYVLGTPASSDPDSDDLSYKWSDESAAEAGPFTVDGLTGTVSVGQSGLDFETQEQFVLNMTVKDTGGLRDWALMTINVLDVNDLEITAITGQTEMNTAGGEEVTLTGVNFGRTDGTPVPSVSATYGPTGTEYTAASCSVTVANTEVVCTSVPGVGGSEHIWTLTVDSWTTVTASPLTTTYQAPTIDSLSGHDVMPTPGGAQLTVTGDNFGPSGSTVSVTVYSTLLEATLYNQPSDCAVTVPSTEIVCTTAEGSGAGLAFSVTVNGVESDFRIDSLGSYLNPTVTGLASADMEVDELVTAGGNSITLTGSDFGPSCKSCYASYGPASEPERYTASCGNPSGHSEVVCTSATGVGTDHVWSFTINGLSSASLSAPTTSYLPPSLDSITGTGTKEASTEGGQQVLLAGANLGPVGTDVLVTYGRVTGAETTAVDCEVSVANTQITCLTNTGTGVDHFWYVTIDGQTSDYCEDCVSAYGAPVLTTLTGTGSVDGVTQGMQTVTVSGANFGTVASNAVDVVTYGPDGSPEEYVASQCNVTVDHTEITCFTSVGGGNKLKWSLVVDGQNSSAPTTAYGAPEIQGIAGDGTNSATLGGDVVTLSGYNFGTTELLEKVTYGSSGFDYEAVNCTVTVDHFEIECLTAPGHGTGLAWVVQVVGLTNDVSKDLVTKYKAPTLSDLSPDGAITNGGSEITLTGENLGLFDYQSVLTVTFNYQAGDDEAVLEPVSHDTATEVVFAVPEGQGEDIRVVVTVDEQTSNAVLFSYFGPRIEQVLVLECFNRSYSCADGENVVQIVGSNFGVEPTVWLTEDDNVTTTSKEPMILTHKLIEVKYAGQAGSIVVQVDERTSNRVYFTYFSPELQEVIGFNTLFRYCADVATAEACGDWGGEQTLPTLGGGVLWLQVKYSLSLSNPAATPTVTIDGRTCPLLLGDDGTAFGEGGGVVSPPTGLADEDLATLYCVPPVGQSTWQLLSVLNADGVMSSSPLWANVNYTAPEVADWEGVTTGTEGATLSFTGTNLGLMEGSGNASADVSVYGDVAVEAIDHTTVTLVVPPGEGAGHTLTLWVGSQQTSTEFSYVAPEVQSLNIEGDATAATEGGQTLTLDGVNFGLASLSDDHVVTLGGADCEITSLDHARVECTVPEGQGAGQSLEVQVSAQLNTDSLAFDYTPPSVSALEFAEGCCGTAGNYTVTMTGANFGRLDRDWELLFGDVEVTEAHIISWEHDAVEFYMPEGQDVDKALSLTVSGQALIDTAVADFDYDPPSVWEVITPSFAEDSELEDWDSTAGGYTVTIVGESFGTANGYVEIDGNECEVTSQTHDEILCTVPEGYGAGLLLKVYVDGRSTSDSEGTFSYEAPDVTAVVRSPFEDVEGTTIEIQGRHFGVTRNPVNAWIDETPCASAVWSDEVSYADVDPYIACDITPGTVGPHNLTVFAGNQTSFYEYYLYSECPDGWYGQIGEYCVECPEEEGAFCDGNSYKNAGDVDWWYLSEVDFDVVSNPACQTDPCSMSALEANCSALPEEPAATASQAVKCEYYTALFECTAVAQCESQVDTTTRAEMARCGSAYTYDADLDWPYVDPAEVATGDDKVELLRCVYRYDEPTSLAGWYKGALETPDQYCQENRDHRVECPYLMPCKPLDSCVGNNECSSKYEGFRCADCAPGHFRMDGECEVCPDCKWCVPVMFLCAGIFAGSISYVLKKKKVNVGILSIGVDYFQVLALFAKSDVAWPASMLSLFRFLSAFNLNLELTAPECLSAFTSVTYQQKWTAIELFPVVLGFFFLAFHWVVWFRKKFVLKRTSKLHTHVATLIGALLISQYYLYLFISRTTLEIFNCSPTDPEDGYTYLSVEFVKCYEPGGLHMQLLPYAAITFCVYTVGYPTVVAWILWTGRRKAQEDQLLRAKDTGEDRKTNPFFDFRKRYSALYWQFKPRFFYWILIILWRKFMIAMTGLMFRSNTTFQLSMSLLVLFISYALQVRNSPYMSMSERKAVIEEAERRAAEAAENEDFVAAHQRTPAAKEHRHGTRKVHLGEKVAFKKRKMSVAKNYFWDYNTVESVLLFCAVLVNLSGIMFNSGQFDTAVGEEASSSAERDFVTYTVMLIVISSLVYFFAVLFSEIAIAFKPEAFQRKKLGDEEHEVIDESEFEMSNLAGMVNPMAGADGKSLEAMRKQRDEAADLVRQQQAEIQALKQASQASQLRGFGGSAPRIAKKKKDFRPQQAGHAQDGPAANSGAGL